MISRYLVPVTIFLSPVGTSFRSHRCIPIPIRCFSQPSSPCPHPHHPIWVPITLFPSPAGTSSWFPSPCPQQLSCPGPITPSQSPSPCSHAQQVPRPSYRCSVPSRYLVLVPITLSPTGTLSKSNHPVPVPIKCFVLVPIILSPSPHPSPHLVPRPSPHHLVPTPSRYLVPVTLVLSPTGTSSWSHHPIPVPIRCFVPVPITMSPSLAATSSQSPVGTSPWSPSPCPVPSRHLMSPSHSPIAHQHPRFSGEGMFLGSLLGRRQQVPDVPLPLMVVVALGDISSRAYSAVQQTLV